MDSSSVISALEGLTSPSRKLSSSAHLLSLQAPNSAFPVYALRNHRFSGVSHRSSRPRVMPGVACQAIVELQPTEKTA